MNFNWVDGVIIAVIFYYLIRGWELGLVYLGSSLISFLVSLVIAIRFHTPIADFIATKTGIPAVWSTVIGYTVVAFASELIISQILSLGITRLPRKIVESKANQWLGAMVSVTNALVLVTFFLLLILALPLRGSVKEDIERSWIGNRLVALSKTYFGEINTTIDQAIEEAQKFITIPTQSRTGIPLNVDVSDEDLSVDAESEKSMVDAANEERRKIGLSPLTIDTKMLEVARSYSRDMFLRRYFSHVDPDGKDAADRLEEAGVNFTRAAENLAYAPNVRTAHDGLMASEGHRVNILDRRFRRIAVGVVDAGAYGKVFTQLFAD